MSNATALPIDVAHGDPPSVADVEIVVPVYNEAQTVEASIRRLHDYVHTGFPLTVQITIADNASTDLTGVVAAELAAELDDVAFLHLAQKGRGRALRAAWSHSRARVLAYMDVDLSTDLDALLPLVAPLLSGHSDLAIGSRLARGSRVVRGPKRELISRSYNMLLRTTLRTRFSDAQCGFKAIRADRARELLPLVSDEEWFFDTELLVIAERAGLRIHEVPVDWVDDPDSRVDIVSTAVADLRGIARLGRSLATGALPIREIAPSKAVQATTRIEVGMGRQLVRFGLIGAATTLLFAVMYLGMRGTVGAQWSNVISLIVATFVNTALNRNFTFGVRGAGAVRHQLQGYVVLIIALIFTSGSLWALGAFVPNAGHGAEVAVLTIANVAATLVKFVLFRAWVFRSVHVHPSTEVSR